MGIGDWAQSPIPIISTIFKYQFQFIKFLYVLFIKKNKKNIKKKGINNSNRCCQDYEVIRSGENYHFHFNDNNTPTNNTKEKIFLTNGKSIDEVQLLINKKYFQILNEIRQNPII